MQLKPGDGEQDDERAARLAAANIQVGTAPDEDEEGQGTVEQDAAEEDSKEEDSGEEDGKKEQKGEQGVGEDEDDEDEEDEGEVTITLGDEGETETKDEQPAPAWVKDVRKANRNLQKENRELQRNLEEIDPSNKVVTLGPKPTFESSGFVEEAFERNLDEWNEKKRLKDAEEGRVRAEEEKGKQQWNEKLARYNDRKAKLRVANYSEAEDVVRGVLDGNQQGIIVDVTKNPEVVVHYLGTHPEKMKELISSGSLAQFSHDIGVLGAQLKVKKTPRTAPEGKIRKGSASVTGSVDNTLEKLRAEAAKSDDYSKVAEYQRHRREKG